MISDLHSKMSATMMKTLAIAALAATSTAHMVMREPVPFTNSIGNGLSDPDNSPLNEDGSNYPCHMSGDYSTDSWTQMAQGSSQTLKFMGSAVHGGGSCQLSVTYDLAPTKSSIFKVIHSVQGGCPARNVAGNLPADSRLFLDPDEYDFSIPDDLPTGKVVLAWTWFNKVGNREMYMNCAPIEITGSSGETSAYNALPDIMVANIGEKQCKVAEGSDVAFPNPGDSVENNETGEFQDVSSQPACSYNWMAGNGQGSIDGGSTGGDDDSSGDSSSAAPSATATATPTVPGGVFVTTGPDSGATTTTAAATDPGTTMATTTTTAAEAQTSSASPSNGGGSSGSCTDGMFNCMGSTFSQCANGQWTEARPLAAGTSCEEGISANLSIMAAAKKSKRSHPRAFRA